MPSYRYPGPRPFEETDIDLFFGRDKDKKNLLTFINVEPLVVLFSKSGLGKSSLVNAGIIPELRKKNYEIILCRFNSYVSKEPGENKYETTSPLQKAFNEIEARFTVTTTFLDKLIENINQLSLWHQFKNLQISGSEKKTYFIFFDQFEELFTYPAEQIKEFKENLAELLNATVPQEYLDQINKLENSASSETLTDEQLALLYEPIPVKLIFTIRSDKFSLLTNLKDAIPVIVTKTYELRPFDRIEATKAIKNPASIEDNSAEGNFISNAFTYDDDAIQKMLNYLTDNNTEDIESFQLQVLCRYVEDIVIDNKAKGNELQKITASQLGEIKNVFEEYYNKLIKDIDTGKIQNVKKLFEDGLIFEKDKIRLSLYKGQIADYGVDENLLNKLVSTHLIRCEPDANGREKYELSHDSLIEPILKAKETRIAEEKEKENLLKQAEEQQKQLKLKQDEQEKLLKIKEEEKKKLETQLKMQKLKSRNRIFAGLIFFIVLIVAVVFYYTQQKDKLNVLSIQFKNDESDWFNALDAWQYDQVLNKDFLLLKNKDSIKYRKLKYSYKCAAYANMNFESNVLLALQFAQEGFLKDSNAVIKKSFDSLIHKPNLHLPLSKIKFPSVFNNIKLTNDEKNVIATTDKGVFWFDIKTGVAKDSLTNDNYKSDYSAFSANGDYVIYESFYGDTTYLLNLLTREYIAFKNNYGTSTHSIAFDIANNNKFLIHATTNNTVSVFAIDGKFLKKYIFPISVDDNINEVSIYADSNYFAAGTTYGEVFLADLKNSSVKLLKTINKNNLHTDIVNSVSFSQDGKFILSGSSDSKIQIWDIKNDSVFQTINYSSPVSRCRFFNDDKSILIGSESGKVSYWNKQNPNSITNTANRSVQQFNDSLQLFGLDSKITSINFYSNNSKIITSSQNEISLWNLNGINTLKINDVVKSGIIPVFQLRDKINMGLLSFNDLLGSTVTKNEVLEGIKLLDDSITRISLRRNRQTAAELTSLVPKFYDHLKDCKEGTLSKKDSFELYNYVSNSYMYKIYMDEDSLNENFGKNNFDKLVAFRQRAFKLDTAKNECFRNLFDAYSLPVAYFSKNKQYNFALFWLEKMLKDNPWLKNENEIQDALPIIYQCQVSINISKGDFEAAKKIMLSWPGDHNNLSYLLSKELVEICTVPHYSFNKIKFSSLLKDIYLKDADNKEKITKMDMDLLDLTGEKNTGFSENIINSLLDFDDYIYPLAYSATASAVK